MGDERRTFEGREEDTRKSLFLSGVCPICGGTQGGKMFSGLAAKEGAQASSLQATCLVDLALDNTGGPLKVSLWGGDLEG